ncbi:diguanylate cylase [Salmonella enterica subsp. enterica serovar Daytona]|uniref:Diguanylate cylase n=1 Tax=Salmonella enterica subsp. enterica serovar Daytona TaxID=1962639 RepID=A0A447JH07_SALET|nr:diguanylate cylase [Salmonella enterica subsp. enterica serovar Daytona]
MKRRETPSPQKNAARFATPFEAINGTHGVNLTRHNYPALHGTLQTAATKCTDNLDDALLLPAFDQAVSINRSQDDHSHGLGTLELKFRYYVDLNKHYVYFYDLINSRRLRHASLDFFTKRHNGY